MSEPPVLFLLSHHWPAEYGRCYRLGKLHLCARCLGTYPVLFGVLAWQLLQHAPPRLPWDPWVLFLLPIPAAIDWALGRFRPRSGANWLRTLTGILLGASLGRSIYINMLRPAHPWVVAQLGALTLWVVAVEVLSRPYRAKRFPAPSGRGPG